MESESTPVTFRFVDPTPDQFTNPNLNVHLQEYWKAEAPVLRGKYAQRACRDWSSVFGRKHRSIPRSDRGMGSFWRELHPSIQMRSGIGIRYKRVMCVQKNSIKGAFQCIDNTLRCVACGELFPENSFGFCINHPDPWQKKRQASDC